MAQISAMGQYGYDDISSGTVTPDGFKHWVAIQAVETAQVDVTNEQGDPSTDLPIPAGAVIRCTATSITVDSGRVLAYRSK